MRNTLIILLLLLLIGCTPSNTSVCPSPQQLAYQEMEMVGFIHFTVNTFTDKEWGFGDEDPAIFNPTQLDAEQWVKVAKEGGLKQLILTAKHHDGFCLWPSAYTEHSVKNSPYKDGEGDVVGEFVSACRKHGLKVGLYLSPWDRNHEDYGSPEYITYYRNQLRELLTNYGEINEIWFDGANGGDGYYGGANEERRVDKESYYDWPTTIALVKELQPDIKIFSDAGPDIRWVGNEHGHAGETFWSTINKEELVIGASDAAYLNRGEADGNSWIIGQCDVSIRPGWFYHASQDSLVKTPEQLMDIYYKSVGRNGLLLLNLPPDQRGLIHEIDAANLKEFKRMIDQTFDENLAHGIKQTQAKQDSVPLVLTLESEAPLSFDRIVLQEDIRKGQQVSRFHVEARMSDGTWATIAEATTIGYKRILLTDPLSTKGLRVVIEASKNPPLLKEVGLYFSRD